MVNRQLSEGMKRLLLGLIFVLCTHPMLFAQGIGDVADRPVTLSPAQIEVQGKQAVVTYEAEAQSYAFTGIAVQGFTDAEVLGGAVRLGKQAEWQPLYIVRSITDGGFMAAYRSNVVHTNQPFTLRFTVDAGVELHLSRTGVFDNRNDADRTPVDGAEADAPAKGTQEIIPPPLIRRSAWGAAPFNGDPIPLARPTYDYMTFHHAAGFKATNLEEGLQQVKAIQDFHQNGRGWSDIGYHFVIDLAGNIYQGRPFQNDNLSWESAPALIQGAHAGGANRGNIGVCLLGCFHPPEGSYCRDEITLEAWEAYVNLFAYMSDRYGVEPSQIRGHRDFGNTACPGDNNYARLPELRTAVSQLLLVGNEPLGQATLEASVDEAGVVQLNWAFFQANGVTRYRIERTYEDETRVIFQDEGAVPDTFTDAFVSLPGTAVYRLIAENENGREQRLAFTEVTIERPDRFIATETFPNPFSQSTTIRYFLDQEGIVTLKVYDRAGAEVATLAQGFQDAGRWYAVPFNASSLASGTYYYRLLVQGFAGIAFEQTRSLTLVK